MPEGPEIERLRDELLILENRCLQEVSFTPSALKYQRYQEQQDNIDLIRGKTLEKLERRGKYLIWWFESLPALNHFGMTGKWTLEESVEEPSTSALSKYAKVILEFENDIRTILRICVISGGFRFITPNKICLKAFPG